MADGPTYKETELAKRLVTLVRNPGTPRQRGVRVVVGGNDTQRQNAVRYARTTYPGQPLGWLDHNDGSIKKVKA